MTARNHGPATRWAHSRAMSGRWLAAAVVVPVALSVLVGLTTHADVEAELRARTVDALAGAGILDAAVGFDGVQGTVSLSAASLPDGMGVRGAQRALRTVDGAHELSIELVPARATPTPTPVPTPAPAPGPTIGPAPDPCADPQAGVDALLGADRVAFGNAGAVLEGPELVQVQQVAGLLVGCGAAVVVVGHTADRAPGPSTLAQDRATTVAGVLTAAGATVTAAVGAGGADPLADNATSGGRRLNRYADIRVR